VAEGLSIPSRGYLEVRFRGLSRLILFVYQCLKRNSFTISSSAALSCRGLPPSTKASNHLSVNGPNGSRSTI
jgi:hypothetical protein